MKFCTQVPRTCAHKRLVLDFHLFAYTYLQWTEDRQGFQIQYLTWQSASPRPRHIFQNTCIQRRATSGSSIKSQYWI